MNVLQTQSSNVLIFFATCLVGLFVIQTCNGFSFQNGFPTDRRFFRDDKVLIILLCHLYDFIDLLISLLPRVY